MTSTETGTTPYRHNEALIYARCLSDPKWPGQSSNSIRWAAPERVLGGACGKPLKRVLHFRERLFVRPVVQKYVHLTADHQQQTMRKFEESQLAIRDQIPGRARNVVN